MYECDPEYSCREGASNDCSDRRLSRREWLSLAVATVLVLPQFRLNAARKSNYVTPEQFGAVGNGVTNDTAAFQKMSAYVNQRRGGVIALRSTTYLVGAQGGSDPAGIYAYAPSDIMLFKGCSKQLVVLGNGARLRCADGLKYGTFDPATGQPTSHPMPYTGRGEAAAPYTAMIRAEGCTGGIDVSNLELDGNVGGLVVGGQYGDTGWQLPADGLVLFKNNCREQVTGVYTHHHGRDGVLISGLPGRTSASVLQSVDSEYNARQGCSLVDGRNYSFVGSKFNHTGRAGLMSSPGAGVDLEAEVETIRDIKFLGCEFSNNRGVGMVADSGDTQDVTFENCKFVGTDTWSAWPYKPGFRFDGCQFVGAVVHPFPDPDPNRATQFSNCTFLDDPGLSPTGKVYEPDRPIVNMAESVNVLFDGCLFKLTDVMVLPWSWNAIYNNCTMSQVSPTLAHPKGTYTGVCTIDGNVELYGAVIVGDLTVNGQLVPKGIA
jgi:hypothetical protein